MEFLEKNKIRYVSKIIPNMKNAPNDEILQNISIKFTKSINLKNYNLRTDNFKFYSHKISGTKKKKYLLIFILDKSEDIIIVEACIDDLDNQILELINDKGEIKDLNEINNKIKEIFDARTSILDKLENPEKLTKEISLKANELIDKGDFEKAQKIVTLAKEVPDKITDYYKTAKEKLQLSNYRSAEKNLLKIYELTEKINDSNLSQYIKLKINKTKQIPAYYKELKNLISNIKKSLKKSLDIPPYKAQEKRLDRCIDLMEKLEEDKNIEISIELVNQIYEAYKLSKILYNLDEKI